MMQRIYGTAWFDKKDLKAYLKRLEEAKERDPVSYTHLDVYKRQESTSAISVTAVSSEVALQEQTVASSEQKSTSQDKTSEGLSEKPVTVNETREASASDLAAANNTSSASSDNFGLKVCLLYTSSCW